ncbi:DUF5689 domain-containing protein [Mucilaginibacter sp. RCC_168]|uniref:DUF5689 domain-containing protein n=1 Tax=Mucilaginibacter sp. RCC_168 TaxID=3239221 RepID=UPI003524D0D8
MKKILFYTLLLLYSAAMIQSCTKANNYPGGELASVIAVADIRTIYKGADITLNTKNMFGAHQMTGIVISDQSGGNMPAGLLVVQNNRRAKLRGIAIPLGAAAAGYSPGDSVVIDIAGGVLKRLNGTLQITGIQANAVTKISSNNAIASQKVTTNTLRANQDNYESTLVTVSKAGFDPLPTSTDTYAGDKIISDGNGKVTLHTEAAASFADKNLPLSANFSAIAFGADSNNIVIPQLRMRTIDDAFVIATDIAPMVISGFLTDPAGTDANYEYIQLLATRDIDFSTENFTIVTTNNAGASTPSGYPVNGWATGDLRTYKLELKSGTVKKGTYFYVGGTGQKIDGSASTSMSSSNWIGAFNYSTANSPNFNSDPSSAFGTKTSNLLANSGNAAGIAVFAGTNITAASKPVDVIFYGTGGSLYDANANVGYRITNNDFYDVKNPVTQADQPFNRQGTNTAACTLPVSGSFDQLGGEYNPVIGRWTVSRSTTSLPLSNSSVITDIEGDKATKLK